MTNQEKVEAFINSYQQWLRQQSYEKLQKFVDAAQFHRDTAVKNKSEALIHFTIKDPEVFSTDPRLQVFECLGLLGIMFKSYFKYYADFEVSGDEFNAAYEGLCKSIVHEKVVLRDLKESPFDMAVLVTDTSDNVQFVAGTFKLDGTTLTFRAFMSDDALVETNQYQGDTNVLH